MDAERCAVAAAFGIRATTAREWLATAYGAEGSTLYEAVQANRAYAGIKAPDSMQHRYIWEDVPASLVPMASLGDQVGVETPAIKNIIHLASLIHGVDYWASADTADRLGLAGWNAPAIRALRGRRDGPVRTCFIVGCALGDCVHVGGVVNFLRLAESAGYEAVCLGPAVAIDRLMGAVIEADPEIVAVGYRLTPDTARELFAELQKAIEAHGQGHRRWVLGGTDPVVEVAKPFGLFEAMFGGTAPIEALMDYLRGGPAGAAGKGEPPQTLMERIDWKAPFPLIRHHYGQPSVDETAAGVAQIAAAGVLDVLSVGTDQNAQEHFFRPDEMDPLAARRRRCARAHRSRPAPRSTPPPGRATSR